MTLLRAPAGPRRLTPADLRRLHVPRWSTTSLERLLQIVTAYPDRSVWDPSTGDYAVVNGWRHRREIAHLFELAAPADPLGIVAAATERARADGADLLMVVETDATRRPDFYARLGMRPLDDVVSLELTSPRRSDPDTGGIREIRTVGPSTLDALMRVDAGAFPWLWRNAAAEFSTYVDDPGVELYGLVEGDRLVAYLGLTAFLGWGHIDRVAVLPELQGRGLGMRLTRFAVDRLARLGARRIGLSTQSDNLAARGMYAKVGFETVPGLTYRVYGRWLVDPPPRPHANGAPPAP